jgi:type I restriction enzyme M protein
MHRKWLTIDRAGRRSTKQPFGSKRDRIGFKPLDIHRLKDESLEESGNLPAPGIIAADIVDNLEAALAQFAEIASDLKK